MDLERYIQLRREREEMAGSAPTRMIDPAPRLRPSMPAPWPMTRRLRWPMSWVWSMGYRNARWRLDGVKPQVLADTVDRVRNP